MTPPPSEVAQKAAANAHAGRSHRTSDADRRAREVGVDVLKAAAILTVIWIHAVFAGYRPEAGLYLALRSLSHFAVPAFFFAAGFLHFRDGPIPMSLFGRRLNRVVLPYLIASGIALVGWSIYAEVPTVADVAFWLATGRSLGIYYFVPPFVGAVALGVLLSRWPRTGAPLFFALFILGMASAVGMIDFKSPDPRDPFFWTIRNPLRWWGYYVAGWLLAGQRHRVIALGKRGRRFIGVAAEIGVLALLGIAFLTSRNRTPAWVVSEYVRIYLCIPGIVLLAWDSPEYRPVRWLSEATYPIYLYHFFFILPYASLYLGGGGTAVFGTPSLDRFVLALGGVVLFIALARRLLGRHARILIG